MGRFGRGRAVLAVAGSVALLVTAPGTAAQAAESGQAAQVQAPVPDLKWRPCGGELKDFECAEASVPTDYDEPHGATTSLALTRLPAAEPDQRIGTLFTNPGGPGGSGVDFVQQNARQAYSQKVRDHFDILGFDPRAVAGSDPATCYRNADEENEALAPTMEFPLTRRQEKAYIEANRELGKSCARRSGDRIAHSSTANVARDMDLLRQAVGDDQLSYAGYSYGTYLGATYGKLFPGRVRALMLDGTMDTRAYAGVTGDPRSVGARIGQGPASHETFQEFLRLCRDAGPSRCALAELGDPRTVTERTFERLKTDPVTVEGPDGTSTVVTYAVAVQTVYGGMYSPDGWTDLAAFLAYLATGGDSGQARVAHRTLTTLAGDRGEDYPSVGGALASMCVDTGRPMPAALYPALADAEDAVAPHLGRFRSWVGIQCNGLGARDTDAYRGPWRQRVDVPVLVIGTRFDPATPYRNTRPYTDDFPDGRMLTLEGWGHTTLGQSGCADRRIADYLVDLTAPADGSTCQPDRRPFTDDAPRTRQLPLGPSTPALP